MEVIAEASEAEENASSQIEDHFMPARSKEKTPCNYYVSKKKRFCRMNRLRGQVYCAEHIPTVAIPDGNADKAASEGGVLDRVPCPLDKKQ